MLSDFINFVASVVHNVVHFFQTLLPGGFGLILVPLIVLGAISIWAARSR